MGPRSHVFRNTSRQNALVPERNVHQNHTNNQSTATRKMKMAATALCLALFASLTVGHLAHPEETNALKGQDGASSAMQPARKLLTGSPMMMGMSMSPMMMPMAPMMMPMAPSMMPAMPMMYMLSLTPSAEVPATMNSMATAMCNLTFMPTSIKYSLSVMNIYAPTAAHIHAGAAGQNGPVVAFLYKNPMMMPSNMTATNGMLSSGTLMSSDFIGPAKNMTVMAFYNKYIATNMAYVNVHTTKNPEGEIRANINSASMVKSA